MDYIEATRAVIKYDMPLNEIIYDFFDALKSRPADMPLLIMK